MKNLFFALFIVSLPLQAAHQLLVFSGEHVAFPGKALCYFSNNRMIPDGERFLVNYTCFDEVDIYSEIWRIDGTQGVRLIRSQPGNLLQDPVSIDGNVFSIEYNEFNSLKLWAHNGQDASSHMWPTPWGRIRMRDVYGATADDLRFRYQDESGAFHEGRWQYGEWSLLADRGVAFFFAAGVSADTMVQKVRLGESQQTAESQPDRIEVRLAPGYVPVTVLSDRDADPSSKYLSFSNLANAQVGGLWVVEARTTDGKVAIVGRGSEFVEIPLKNHFSVVDAWHFSLTIKGELVLRGTDVHGQKGLWIYRGNRFELLLSQGDEVLIPNGEIALVGNPLFYNSPLVVGDKLYIGVGLSEETGSVFIGQGVLQLPL